MSRAEELLDIVYVHRHMAHGVQCFDGPCPDWPAMIANVALAHRLRSRPDVAIRAVVEDWDQQRIVRELW